MSFAAYEKDYHTYLKENLHEIQALLNEDLNVIDRFFQYYREKSQMHESWFFEEFCLGLKAQQFYVKRFIGIVQKLMPQNAKILDIGVVEGSHYITALALKLMGFDVHAIDPLLDDSIAKAFNLPAHKEWFMSDTELHKGFNLKDYDGVISFKICDAALPALQQCKKYQTPVFFEICNCITRNEMRIKEIEKTFSEFRIITSGDNTYITSFSKKETEFIKPVVPVRSFSYQELD